MFRLKVSFGMTFEKVLRVKALRVKALLFYFLPILETLMFCVKVSFGMTFEKYFE